MSGLIMLPGALGQAIAQFFGGKAPDRFGARPVALLMETFAAMRQAALGGGADVAIAASVFCVQWALGVRSVIDPPAGA